MPTPRYYATLDRNGTEDEITIFAPNGRRMLCIGFWDAESDDDPLKHDADQLKADALLIVHALNAYDQHSSAHPDESSHTMTEIEPFDVHKLLEDRHTIAFLWDIDDVKQQRPDLDDEQCWEVLKECKRYHDANIGMNWSVIDCIADMLFGDAPEISDAAEDGDE